MQWVVFTSSVSSLLVVDWISYKNFFRLPAAFDWFVLLADVFDLENKRFDVKTFA